MIKSYSVNIKYKESPKSIFYFYEKLFFANKIIFRNRKYHSTDGPAIEYTDSHKEWYINGLRHRDGGPAVECQNSANQYWKNGVEYWIDGTVRTCMNPHGAAAPKSYSNWLK